MYYVQAPGVCSLYFWCCFLTSWYCFLCYVTWKKKKKKKKILEIFVIKALLHMAVKLPAEVKIFLLLEQ